MGRSRFKFHENYHPYFITSSIVDGIPLFSDPQIVNIVLDSFRFIQYEWDVKLYGYVIMENHLHCTVQHEEISKIVKNFKSYTAKMIINSLEKRGRSLILDKLIFAKKIQKKQSQYQVWQEGVHPTQIDSDEKMEKVLDYIHFNPVKAGFVSNPEHWRYSSAIDYTGKRGLVPVTLFGENRSLSFRTAFPSRSLGTS